MAKGATFAGDQLKLLCNGTPIPNLADNAASLPATFLYFALHTADPSGGNQTTSEISYAGYARGAVARSSSGLLVVGNTVFVVADLVFPAPSGIAAAPALYGSLGIASSGAGKVLYASLLSPALVIEIGNPPIIRAGSKIIET